MHFIENIVIYRKTLVSKPRKTVGAFLQNILHPKKPILTTNIIPLYSIELFQ